MITSPQRYRKKPVVIEAMPVRSDNLSVICRWINTSGGHAVEGFSPHIWVTTLEGTMRADLGDWVIRGVKGEFYPCKPEIFEATYEPAYEVEA